MAAQASFAREQLADQERRARRELDSRWEMLLRQLEHQQALQHERIDADRNLRVHQKQIDSWPLGIIAANIIDTSRRRPAPTLNLILKVTSGPRESSLLDLTVAAVALLDRDVRKQLGDDLLFYQEGPSPGANNLLGRGNPVSGRSLVSTLNGLLHTEPTALLEVTPEGRALVIDGAFWGWGCEPESERGMARRTPSPLILDLPEDPDEAAERIRATLLLLIVAMADAYSLLNRWDQVPRLRLFGTIAELGRPGQAAREDERAMVEELKRLIEQLSRSAPALAAEAAASAAMEAWAAGLQDFAQSFLDSALASSRDALRDPPADTPDLVRALMSVPEPGWSPVQHALVALRDAAPIQAEAAPRPSLTHIIAAATRRLQKERNKDEDRPDRA